MLRDDCAGRFHFGHIENQQPESTPFWRVLVERAEVALELRSALDGEIRQKISGEDSNAEMQTKKSTLDIYLDGPQSISSEMLLWEHGEIRHHCDGEIFISPIEDKGRECGCPKNIDDQKRAARDGLGPQPSVTLTFQIARLPRLGTFSFLSNSWNFTKDAREAKNSLDAASGRALCHLHLNLVDLKSAGTTATYVRPSIELADTR